MPFYPLPPLFFLVLTAWAVGYAVYREVIDVVLVKYVPGPAILSVITLLIGIPLARLLADRRE